jgi:hypothetical protein
MWPLVAKVRRVMRALLVFQGKFTGTVAHRADPGILAVNPPHASVDRYDCERDMFIYRDIWAFLVLSPLVYDKVYDVKL